jgi:hypothetical protein
MIIDLVNEEVDPYKAAMRNHLDGGCETLLYSKPHSCSPSILHNKVYILFTCLFNFRLVFFLLVRLFLQHICLCS